MEKTEYIYLMPGNWFELKNIIADKTNPYDIDMFKTEILDQVNNRAEKLDFINVSFGIMYKDARLEDITFHLDKEKFNRIAQILSSEKRHPIITFHGTKPDAVKSIFQQGYIIPSNNSKGMAVRVAHGAAYGVGIYSSPFFDKANYYAKPDSNGYIYILINMLFPGRAKLIPPCGPFTYKGNPTNGSYSDGTNTRIVYGLDQIVSADQSRIIPIAVMKINIANK